MKINDLRALRGPNYSHSKPVIFMEVDLEDYEYLPTHKVSSFRENIEKMMPTLIEHTCSPRVRGGFFQRVERGTWPGHVIEHVAIELQNLIGHKVTFGKTYTKKEKGIYHIVYRYLDENVGLRAGEMAFDLVSRLYEGEVPDINPYLIELGQIARKSVFGPSTKAIVDEAKSRGIEYYRLNDYSYVQLGQGKYQRRFEATTMDDTSAIAVQIAKDKDRSKKLLYENGIPVPIGDLVKNVDEAVDLAKEIGYPVVVKPHAGNHGRGITTNITTEEEVREACKIALEVSDYIIIEKHLTGSDFRVLVIDGKFTAAALREPAYIIGNGRDSIRELINKVNSDSSRGLGHEKELSMIEVDSDTYQMLEKQNLSMDDILHKDIKIYLKSTANISSGGTATDVTDSVHHLNRSMFERISRLIGLNVMGIDIIAPGLEQPLTIEDSGIIELNSAPGLRMHLNPSHGQSRNVAKNIVDMLFPDDSRHSIPICAVTGTNGKTTTTRLITHILKISGNVVGMTSTDGVVVDNICVQSGDYSGPQGALTLMKDSTIDHAVLEVARGGIIRRGLGFKKCDVGVLLNVSSDHLGLGGIETIEDLTRLKSVVTESVKEGGYAVYNADDELVLSRSHLTKGIPIFFSKDNKNKYLMENLKKGNVNVTIQDEEIVLQQESGNFSIAKISEIPITFDGRAEFNIENAMAATAACYGLGVEEEHIRAGLISFSPNIGQSPGRMNLYNIGDIKVVVDYGHNVAAAHATGEFFRSITSNKSIRLVEPTGDRRTEDIIDFGKAVALYHDYFIISATAPRTRKLGESADIVKNALLDVGIKESKIEIINDEKKAVERALSLAEAGDLVVLQVDDVNNVTDLVLEFKDSYLEALQKNKSII